MSLRAAVLGASGYTGGEVARLLSGHPAITLEVAAAHQQAGRSVAELQPHLASADLDLLPLDDALGWDGDVCFSCLPATTLPPLVTRLNAHVVIDLADDFRSERDWAYGLTEFTRGRVAEATHIANPGCYPTAALLALVPLARSGALTGEIVIDALSGVTGAGRRHEDRLLHAHADGNAGAYGSTSHRHIPEIERGLAGLSSLDPIVSFTPHLVPMARGVLVTARARPARKVTDEQCLAILDDAYASEPFVSVLRDWPSTKPVMGSNSVHVSARVDNRAGWIICSAAIDNLVKGAAGQAIQNANVALGIEETSGLPTVGLWP
jgi:N-acetyl-gamma-glutamyl-phosphate reductase